MISLSDSDRVDNVDNTNPIRYARNDITTSYPALGPRQDDHVRRKSTRACSQSNLNDNYPIHQRNKASVEALFHIARVQKANTRLFVHAALLITQSPLMHRYGKVQTSCHIAPSREWIMHVWAHGKRRISPTVKVPAPMLSRPVGITSASDALIIIGTRPGSRSVG